MKKFILPILLFLMFIPLVVNAETCDTDKISISSIAIESKSDNVEELSEATVSGKSINLDLSMSDVGDYIEYELVVKNDSNEDYELDKTGLKLNSDYIDYSFETEDNSNIVKANSSKNVTIRVEYKNEVPEDKFKSGSYNDSKTMIVQLSNGNTINVPDTFKNPNTGVQSYILIILILLLISGSLYVLLKKKEYTKFMTLVIGTAIIIPISVYALCKYDIKINSEIIIKKNHNPCRYDGKLTTGTEYINGQYTYRYNEVYSCLDGCVTHPTIADGWSVRLTNLDSTDTVNTKLCTSINDKPIVSMRETFAGAKATNIDLSSFDTSNVYDMSYMFAWSDFEHLDMSNFDVSNVIYMNSMFYSSKANNLNMNNWNTSNVENMHELFCGVPALKLDVSSFNTSNVYDMSYMFANTGAEILDLSNFDTSNVTNMSSMFARSNATSIDYSKFDTKNVVYMNNTFAETKISKINISNFNTSNVISMVGLFQGSSATEILLTGIDTKNVTDMGFMFSQSNVQELNLSSLNTSNVTVMASMFANTNLTELDLSGFNTSKVNDMSNMFANTKLRTIDLGSFSLENISNSIGFGRNGLSEMFRGTTATIGYAKSETEADKFNSSSRKPTSLTFTVK